MQRIDADGQTGCDRGIGCKPHDRAGEGIAFTGAALEVVKKFKAGKQGSQAGSATSAARSGQ
jgi:hypothetical protein